MVFSNTSPTTVLESKTKKAKYPEVGVIVLYDIFNTFEHVANCLIKIIPGMIEKRINDSTMQVFESIENDSKELDSLDDPSADINPNN